MEAMINDRDGHKYVFYMYSSLFKDGWCIAVAYGYTWVDDVYAVHRGCCSLFAAIFRTGIIIINRRILSFSCISKLLTIFS